MLTGTREKREKKVSSVFIIILGRFEIVFYGLANAIKIRNVFHGSERGEKNSVRRKALIQGFSLRLEVRDKKMFRLSCISDFT
jgi:hypothetical protein